MDKKNVEKLDRLVEFVQQNFEQITSETDITKALLEAGDLFQSNLFAKNSLNKHPFKFLCKLSENAEGLLRRIIETTEKNGYIGFHNYFFLYCNSNDGEGSYRFERDLGPISGSNKEQIAFFSAQYEPTIYEVYPASKVIFDLLIGLPLSRLKKCLYCEKIFVQKTAREKKYCSDLCKNRHNLKLKETGE